MPDRLPSLIVLVGFWVIPAVAGWFAAGYFERRAARSWKVFLSLAAFVGVYAAAWFLFNVDRMPPYIPGATMDPANPPPEAVSALALFSGLAILPGSAIACALAFRRRRRMMRNTPPT